MQKTQLVQTGVHVLAARGLADVAITHEGGHGCLDVPVRQGALVGSHHVREPEVRISLQQRGRTTCRPVSGQLLEYTLSSVSRLSARVVRHDRDG